MSDKADTTPTETFDLNEAQQRAVDITDGSALVVAGAGTGKTRVIVERINRLVNDGVQPECILALTFTEKAAGEMLDRVNASKLGVTLDTTIATFNRFGNDLLSAYGAEWGLGTIRLLGETGQLVFLREHFDELELDYFAPISNPDGQLELLAGYVSRLKQQLVTPDHYFDFVKKMPSGDEAEALDRKKHQELAEFFATYLKLCRREQVIDYDDQIYLTIQLLEQRPNILQQLQERYKYILVDEFQDTNPMQSRLVDLLAGKGKNVMVVGDDDQSIYGWRGATLANILDFKQRYPKAQDVTLIENYRSTQSILDSSYRLIQHNNPNRLEVMNELDKRLHAQTKGPGPKLEHFATLEAELAWLAEDINRRLASGQEAGSIAVLSRRNLTVQKIHEALELHAVSHVVAGLGNDIYAQNVVRQLVEALKAIADPQDDMALFHALSGPLFGLNLTELSQLSGGARREQIQLAEALATSDEPAFAAALKQLTEWREIAHEQSVGSLAYTLMTDSGWKQRLYEDAQREPAVISQIQALAKYFTTLKEFERIAGVPSVQNYVISLPVLQAAGSQFEDPTLDISDDQVNVLSVHRAKGLEWETVYIVDCTEGSFPLSRFGAGLEVPSELQINPSEADEHMAEERRLMYVAATRARQDLVLSYSNRHGAGATRRPSRFLQELLGHEPDATAQEEAGQTTLELFAPKTSAQDTIALPESMRQNDRLVLSVSQIETWLRCPQDFYYKYVLNMPLPPAPQLAYGSLVHGVIERIHKAREQGAMPELRELTASVVDNLPRAGYQSARSRDRASQQAIRTVKTVFERFSRDDLPIETELPFSIEVEDLPLTIRGRIDAVYKLGDGVEIRDFKTGTSVRTAEQAKSRVSGSQQLTLYALAWQQLRGELPAKLSLDFVETGQIYGIRKQAKSLDTLHAKLEQMVSNLQAGEYPAGRDHKRCMHPIDD